MAKLSINGKVVEVDVEDDTPLLWVIREHVGLTGTKYGCGVAQCGACTVKDGRIEQENFDTYEVLRMDAMPAVEVIAMPSGGFWGGVGEPTIAVAAPAVLNAVFAATGKRVRDLPLKNADLGSVG